jgi:hypothetical protein
MDAEAELAGFLAKYEPEIAERGAAAIAWLRARLPGASVLVYDNYNALAVGFGPSERASEAILSVALYPRWVSLFFLQGAHLPDPDGLLQGKGSAVRHIVLPHAEALAQPAVADLIARALAAARVPIAPHAAGRLVIKSVSAKQRPRRPALADRRSPG